MKTSTSFRMSESALSQLAELAKRYQKSNVAVLEHLIADRASSSNSRKNSERRDENWRLFCETSGVENNDKNRAVWNKAYSCGWMDFQKRHGDNDFILHFD